MSQSADHVAKVKNKNPASIQITAEQILREATDRVDRMKAVPAQKIADMDELNDYRLRRRRGFEEFLQNNRTHVTSWLRYAAWETNQKEYERARSVYERGLQVDHRTPTLWLKYAEMEMKLKNVNHARNIFDRATAVLPRVDMFWYKYTYMEELLDQPGNARQVFERWMKWKPSEDAWMAFVAFEKRYKEFQRAKNVFKRFVQQTPKPKNWIKWAKFEEELGDVDMARRIYQECNETLGEYFLDQNIFVSFAKFEIRQGEYERARVIFKYALEKLPKSEQANLYNAYTQFEKQFGGKDGIEDVVTTKRRNKYEDDLKDNPSNYDTWFDYARLEEGTGNVDRIREVYERALSNTPPIQVSTTENKKYWRRYIYIWLFYAIWEETTTKDYERVDTIYKKCLEVIPHKSFTFAKVWLQYAKFLIRRLELTKARKVLGRSIGMSPKSKLFKGYIELELQLREFDRARKLYEKFLSWSPANCYAWIKYTELERMLGDVDRARGIFDLAIVQATLDMPEVLWKGYIDFEIEEGDYTNARKLYEMLLEKTQHVKVWIAFAKFELDQGGNGIKASREIFKRANELFKKDPDAKEQRTLLLETWRDIEKDGGTQESLDQVSKMLPKVVKKRRKVQDHDNNTVWEEYFDYIFPDDVTDASNFKLLALAQQWKSKGENDSDEDSSSDEEDED